MNVYIYFRLFYFIITVRCPKLLKIAKKIANNLKSQLPKHSKQLIKSITANANN